MRLSNRLYLFSILFSDTIAWTSRRMVMSASRSSLPRANEPILKIPEPIRSNTPGTWAYDTMSRRVDAEILERTWQDNKETWSRPEWKPVTEKFQKLRTELQNAATTKLRHLEELPSDASEERQREWREWKEILDPFVQNNDTWLTAPWMVTEFFLYRRLMECLGYWDPNSVGYQYDPFAPQKRSGLESSVASAERMLEKIPKLPSNSKGLQIAAGFSLWGNKMDLSLWPADISNKDTDIFSAILEQAHENLLHDDSSILSLYCDTLRAQGGGKVDIVVDNAGFELVTDLALAHHLITSGIANVVTFQLKSHPTFVSDALAKDLQQTVDYYCNLDSEKYPNACQSGQLWQNFLTKGQWKLNEANFWTQGVEMWAMKDPLRTDLATRCDLCFVKGDANYRRLLGDRQWDYSADFDDVVACYFPCPICALRTLKAELGCGMDADQIERAKRLDDKWMVNGRFGVVQFGPKSLMS